MGTSTIPDFTSPAVITSSEEVLPSNDSIKKKEMISYQSPDGSINSKLPPVNGKFFSHVAIIKSKGAVENRQRLHYTWYFFFGQKSDCDLSLDRTSHFCYLDSEHKGCENIKEMLVKHNMIC